MIDYIDKNYFKLAIPGPYKENEADIAAKCPICGDSKHKRATKRLHLFFKDNKTRVKCFNGGCPAESARSLGNFLKLFYPNFFENYNKEKFKTKIQVLNAPKTETAAAFAMPPQNVAKVEKAENVENAENVDNAIPTTIRECITAIGAHKEEFLKSRGLNSTKLEKTFGQFYEGIKNATYNGRYYGLKGSLFIPIFLKGIMTGFYSRSFTEKRFVNASFVSNGFVPWNLCNIDNSKPVYIFEAIIDALSFYELYGETNVIALCTNNINPAVLGYIAHPHFCLDNDVVGIETMIKHTNDSKCRFLLWPKNFKCKDFNETLLSGAKFDLEFASGMTANLKLRSLL